MARFSLIAALVVGACTTPATTTDETDETDVVVIDSGDDSGGDTSTVDSDTDTDTDVAEETDDTDPPRQQISCKLLPTIGFADACDLSVNNATATSGAVSAAPIVLDVRVSTNTPTLGGYNGNGRGNRAIVGFHNYNRLRLDALASVTFDAEKMTGSFPLELFLQVDLACDGVEFVLLTVGGDDWPTPEPVTGSVERRTADPTAQVWSAVSGLLDPADPFNVDKLLYDAGDPAGEPRTLGGLLGTYPDACIRNFASGFRDLPVSPTASSGVLLAMGSSATWNLRGQWKVWRVTVNDDVHLPVP